MDEPRERTGGQLNPASLINKRKNKKNIFNKIAWGIPGTVPFRCPPTRQRQRIGCGIIGSPFRGGIMRKLRGLARKVVRHYWLTPLLFT